MRLHHLFLVAPLAAVTAAGAQTIRSEAVIAPRVFATERSPRAVLGITTSPSGSARDTLGLLVSSVHPGGPAERAGIEEGNRLVSINGVNLRLAPADIDDHESASLVSRRLTRELSKLDPGATVELRVHTGNQTRTMRVTTADADTLYERARSARQSRDHAAIGVTLGSSGSVRDTLGVFVMSVVDTGPAARAGIEEGHRIAAINGVDLRVPRDDRDDQMVSQLRVRRLQRELAKVKAGDQVELRVYAGGQYRTVRVRTVKASELAGNRTMIMGDAFMPALRAPAPPAPPAAFRELVPSRIPMRIQHFLEMTHARPGEPGRARALHEMLRTSRSS